MIVLATGGYLKQSKCQVGLVFFEFVNGVSRIKKLQKIPKHQFMIPQKDNKMLPTSGNTTADRDSGANGM